MSTTLLDQIITASELSPIFARGAIMRALKRAGVPSDDLTRSQLRTALPEIRRAIEPFLQGKTDAVIRKIEALID